MTGKSILSQILFYLARGAIGKYKPVVIGVTGSVGKTSAREAIYAVLKKKFRVRSAEKNYNNEIGIPLTILGIPHCGRSVFKWFAVLAGVIARLFLQRSRDYPKALILEYGIDRPRDMDYLLKIAKPDFAVITAIGDIPAHVEFFKDEEELIYEKSKLVRGLKSGGAAILNHDDYAVYDMRDLTKEAVFTFGTEEKSDVRITDFRLETRTDPEKRGIGIPYGISFKLSYMGDSVLIRLSEALSLPHAYSASAAGAVALKMSLSLKDVADSLRGFIPPPGRLRLLPGIRDTLILDDTYNASPESMRAALETLRNLPGKRKIAVLGDMLEIGRHTEGAHRALGDMAREFVDLIYCVGPRAGFIADEVASGGIQKNARSVPRKSVLKFADSLSAGKELEKELRPGDLILIKGSQAMRMEHVVKEIMAHPERSKEFLVRQDEYWLKK